MRLLFVATLLAVLPFLAVTAAAPSGTVYLTVAFCPGVFNFGGNVVEVDVATGKFKLVREASFKWPTTGGDGCTAIQMDPNFFVDDANTEAYLDLTSDFGFVVGVDFDTAVVNKQLKSHSGALFDGFTSFTSENLPNPAKFLGVTPHVTQDGWCSDGCFAFATQSLSTGDVTIVQAVPFKAIQTDVDCFHDPTPTSKNKDGVFYVQASYPLTPDASCSSDDSAQCIVGIDVDTGAIVSTKPTPTWEAYAYSHSTYDVATGNVMAWIDGFVKECKDPYDDFAFATVNLKLGNATLHHCIEKGVVVDTDPATSDFSADGSLFAQSSGNSETGEVQLLVFDVGTGDVVVNSTLPGLKAALHVSAEAPFIDVWAVSI